MNKQEYAGFWIRSGAAIIDTVLVLIIIGPILTAIYGTKYWISNSLIQGTWDVLLNYILPAVAIIIFWAYKSATPGKMATNLTIVDAKTGSKPSTGQFIGRYLAYFVSTIPLFLGIIWVGIDKRKQGWHDKLAGTVVIRNNQPESVIFEKSDMTANESPFEADLISEIDAATKERNKNRMVIILKNILSLIDKFIRGVALVSLVPFAISALIMSTFMTDSPSSGILPGLIALFIFSLIGTLILFSSLRPGVLAEPFSKLGNTANIIARLPAYIYAPFGFYYGGIIMLRVFF